MAFQGNRRSRCIGLALLLCGSVMASGAAGHTQQATLAKGAEGESQHISLPAGTERVFRHHRSVLRVSVADPAVADVQLLSGDEVMVTGKKPGTTEARIWGSGADHHHTVEIAVLPPELGPAASYESQVQIDLQIVELSRRAMRSAGMQISFNDGDNVGALAVPGLLSAVESGGGGGFLLESATGFLPIAQAFNLVYGDAGEHLLATVSVLEANGMAHTLAEPTLVATSGQTATFLAGGEFPVPVVQDGGNSSSITIEYKPFGVRVMVTPTVLGPDRIALKVAPEVSELDFSSGVQSGGVTVPGLITRRADTTIQMGPGESFAITGLVNHRLAGNVDKVPWIGDVPILGAFFKSTRFDREDRELLMIVSPHLVRPMRADAPALPLPGEEYNDYLPGVVELQLFESGDFDPEGGGFFW